MTIASYQFLAFVLAVALAYNLVSALWWRQGVLLVANGMFLATFATGFGAMIPLSGFLGAGYACLLVAQRRLSRHGFIAVLASLLLLFFWLKRYSFLPAATFLPFRYSVIGLSYIFFRVLQMVLDARGGTLMGRVSPIAYLNYTLNFTSLVSGPIQRFQDYQKQQLSADRPPLSWIAAGRAVERVAAGLFKVVVLSAVLHVWHLRMLADFRTAHGFGMLVATALGATVGYTFYLYCNFSGYTDIVIGAARFYRLTLPENFDRPFSATTFMDFWARWHMTLSEWLKTYVYNPLVLWLMERYSAPGAAPFLGVIAFFVTFFLIGLWHGQTSVFAVYGLLLGFGVSINKLWQVELAKRLGRRPYRELSGRFWYRSLARGLTFVWFVFSLVFFWGNWETIGALASGLGVIGAVTAFVALTLSASVALAAIVETRDTLGRIRIGGVEVLSSRYTRTVATTVITAIAMTVLSVLASPAPDVVYKTF
jgi:D-alanyl-lipoteichoic acid acyltransferase DltB (MBOAT superfamily)